MQSSFELRFAADGSVTHAAGGLETPVMTVRDACRALGRSRRQLYRLMRQGLLPVRAKALGECLLDAAAVARLARRPAQAQRLPAALAPLVPEYDLAALNAGRDAELVLSRVLDGGGEDLAAWALRRYGAAACATFVAERGAALSPRARAFWEAYLGVRARPAPAWRRRTPWRA